MVSTAPTLRRRLYEILEAPKPGDRLGSAVDLALIALIAVNVVAVILESVESVLAAHAAIFMAFEAVSVFVFTAEYGLRLWVAPERGDAPPAHQRWRYARSGPALVDLAAILPFYLSALFVLDLRFLRVLRLLRVLKLTRYSAAMGMLLEVLYQERRGFGAAFSILAIVMVFASSGIYLVEHTAQPDAFGSIPASMWWAVSTLTTVGYGDVTPITPLGKVFAGVVTIIGVGTVALPTGLLASGFAELHKRNRLLLEAEAEHALEDGVVTPAERASYEALAEALGVDPETALAVVLRVAGRESPDSCPHCGKSLAPG